jgi:outer membrane usher protein FimD/PapC
VRINTPGGPVWTDAWGRAVMPTLYPYRKSRLEVATKSLPRNVDIKNGFKSLDAGRGSFHSLDFDVVTVRRVLMQVTNPDGVPIPKGASVVDSQGQFMTTVVDAGKLFLSNGQLTDDMKVNLADGTQCRLDYRLPERVDLDVYFETTNAVCRPFGLVPKL